MNKKQMSEQDIRTKYITPAILAAGWDRDLQIREEVSFTKGKITVRRKIVKRGEQKRADYILYWKPNIPLAIVEAKDNNHNIADGMEQALNYAEILDIPFVFTSNGDGFSFYDKTAEHNVQIELALDQFPSPEELWARYKKLLNSIRIKQFRKLNCWQLPVARFGRTLGSISVSERWRLLARKADGLETQTTNQEFSRWNFGVKYPASSTNRANSCYNETAGDRIRGTR